MGRDGHAQACIACPLRRPAESRGADKVPQFLHLFAVDFSEELVLGHKNQKKRCEHLARDQNANICAHVVAAAEEDAAEELDAVGHSQRAAELEEIGETRPGSIELRGCNAEGVENADGSGRERPKRELTERYCDAECCNYQPA